MSDFSLVAGDLEPDMPLTATMNDVAEALTGALAIEMRWRKPDGTLALVDLTAVDLATGQVKRVWDAGDSDMVGTHLGRIVVTRSTGEIQTFPNDGSWFAWTVVPAS